MTKISRKEVLAIAEVSHLALHDDEVQPLIDQLEQMLNYAKRVADIPHNTPGLSTKNSNIFREDVVHQESSASLLEATPHRVGTHFVVPRIIENN